MNKRVLLIGNCYTTIAGFRKELIEELINQKYDVYLAFPNHSHGEKENGEDFAKEKGCRFIELELNRRSANILMEIKCLYQIRKIIEMVNPECVLLFTIKPNIYGGLICRNKKIPFIINVTGLGSGMNGGLISTILRPLYVRALNSAEVAFFQNVSDYQLFTEWGYKKHNQWFLPGSGVNLNHYRLLPYPNTNNTTFLYTARVMKEKGIDEFLAAAKEFKNNKNVNFEICGDCEEDYKEYLVSLEKEGTIKYNGRVSDIIPYIDKSSCVVIPTFYHEGMSNCVLEAAACGRPVITTKRPGSEEAIDDGVNGYLITEKNVTELLAAINKFIELSYDKRSAMGKAGRYKMEKEFDRAIVVDKYINAIEDIIKG